MSKPDGPSSPPDGWKAGLDPTLSYRKNLFGNL